MNRLLDKYTAFIFDFDFTLADGSAWTVRCFQEILHRHGYTSVSDDTVRRTIGMVIEDAFKMMTGVDDFETNHHLREEFASICRPQMAAHTTFYPEAVRFIKDLKSNGRKVGILSTKMSSVILQTIKTAGMEKDFDSVLGITDIQNPKPDPSGIALSLRRLQTDPGECLYIGDNTIDARTAQNASVDFIGTLTGVCPRQDLSAYPHILLVNNLGELI